MCVGSENMLWKENLNAECWLTRDFFVGNVYYVVQEKIDILPSWWMALLPSTFTLLTHHTTVVIHKDIYVGNHIIGVLGPWCWALSQEERWKKEV